MENSENVSLEEYWKPFTFYLCESWIVKSYPRQTWLDFFALLKATQSRCFSSFLNRNENDFWVVSILLGIQSESATEVVLKPLAHMFEVDNWIQKDDIDWSKWVSFSVNGIPEFIDNAQRIGNYNSKLINLRDST